LAESKLSAAPRKPAVTKEEVLQIAAHSSAVQAEIESRTRALESYLNTDIPDRVTHLWRYSDPSSFFPEPAHRTGTVVDTDGAIPVVGSLEEFREKGIDPVPLHRSERGLSLLGNAVSHQHGFFESLNGALWTHGMYIRIPRGTVLQNPIQIVHRASDSATLPRIVVEIEPFASADVVEIFEGGEEQTRVVAVSELFVSPNASLRHAVVQQWNGKVRGHVTVRAMVAEDAVFRETSLALGGGMYKCDLGADLAGIGAESEIVGVSFSDRKQHMDFHTVHRHRTQKTRSRINFKAALSGKSVSAYTGLIQINADAVQSEALQESRNLMLSDKAKAHAIPELEIMTNEVQCSHAAASAPLRDDELFYLASRGVPPSDAKAILVRGFFNDVFSKIPGPLREQAAEALEERLTRTFYKETP